MSNIKLRLYPRGPRSISERCSLSVVWDGSGGRGLKVHVGVGKCRRGPLSLHPPLGAIGPYIWEVEDLCLLSKEIDFKGRATVYLEVSSEQLGSDNAPESAEPLSPNYSFGVPTRVPLVAPPPQQQTLDSPFQQPVDDEEKTTPRRATWTQFGPSQNPFL